MIYYIFVSILLGRMSVKDYREQAFDSRFVWYLLLLEVIHKILSCVKSQNMGGEIKKVLVCLLIVSAFWHGIGLVFKNQFGKGDVILLSVLCLLDNIYRYVLSIFCIFVLSFFVSGFCLIKEKGNVKKRIAFVPVITAGTWLSWVIYFIH